MTVDEFRAKMLHVDEAKFTDWFERMEAKYREIRKLYDNEMEIRKRMPKGKFTVPDLPQFIKTELDTTAESLFFSADGVAKQLMHHPEVKVAEYAKVLDKMHDCKTIKRTDEYHVALIVVNKRHYKVILKTDKKRSQVYLVSLFRLD
jgi:hypothetical protein